MAEQKYEIGMVGLGVMGRNLVLNIADHGYTAGRLAVELGLPVPCFMAALAYFDGYRSAWLPANLIQAQRDDFGAHAYERIDAKGTFHTHWE